MTVRAHGGTRVCLLAGEAITTHGAAMTTTETVTDTTVTTAHGQGIVTLDHDPGVAANPAPGMIATIAHDLGVAAIPVRSMTGVLAATDQAHQIAAALDAGTVTPTHGAARARGIVIDLGREIESIHPRGAVATLHGGIAAVLVRENTLDAIGRGQETTTVAIGQARRLVLARETAAEQDIMTETIGVAVVTGLPGLSSKLRL